MFFLTTFLIVSTISYSQNEITFSEVVAQSDIVKNLKKQLKDAIETGKDNAYISELSQQVDTELVELQELWKAHEGSEEGVFNFLEKKYYDLASEWGSDAAMKIFNKTYGDRSIYYTFEGYILEREGYLYVFVNEPNVSTQRLSTEVRSRDFLFRNRRLILESKAQLENDSMLYKGHLYIRESRVSDYKPYDWSKARNIADSSLLRISTYRDTTTRFIEELMIKDSELSDIIEEKEDLQDGIQKLSRARYDIKKPSANLGYYNKFISEIIKSEIESENIEGLQEIIEASIPVLQNRLSEKENEEIRLKEYIETIEAEAFENAHANAVDFFLNSWDKYHVRIDGFIQIDDWYDEPYLYLDDWSIRRKK